MPLLFSVRKFLTVSMVLLAVVPALLMALFLVRSGQRTTSEMAGTLLSHVADQIQINSEDHILQAHEMLNGLISDEPSQHEQETARVWLQDNLAFEGMAFALLRQVQDVDSVYRSDTRGNYLGVSRMPDGLQASEHRYTESGLRHYRLRQPGDRSQPLPSDATPFDPLWRMWYRGAVQRMGRGFTLVRTDLAQRQLLLRLSQPVLAREGGVAGVLGVDLRLQSLADNLRIQRISARGAAFIVDGQGLLVASSAGDPLLRPARDGTWERTSPAHSANPLIRQGFAVSEALRTVRPADLLGLDTQVRREETEQGTVLMVQRAFGQAQGLDWTLVVAVPEGDFATDIQLAWRTSLVLVCVLLFVGGQFAWVVARGMSDQLLRLGGAAGRLGRGEVPEVEQHTTISEVYQLSLVLHDTALQLNAYREQAAANALALKQANETLESRVAERTAQLAASREEALAAARAKAAFLATMSHEIRTPLNGVVGMTALLSETPLDTEQRDYLQTIRLSSSQLLAVINDVLDFSKIESGKLVLESEPVSLRSAVEEACEISAPRAREKGLELIIDLPDETSGEAGGFPAAVLGDVTRLRQVLLNLVNNAVKFTHHGDVTISARRLPPQGEGRDGDGEAEAEANAEALIEFRVTDTGIGIPADRQPSLFQAFTQGDASTTRKYGGSGLGLAICHRLVQMMGGTIGVESQVGQGSSFWFTLRAPVSDAQPVSVLAGVPLLQGRRVLVVDDHPTNIRLLQRQLSRWGMQVSAAASGAEALRHLEQAAELPDLVITDMHMPDMDGMALAQALHGHPRWGRLGLVLLSSGYLPSGPEAAWLFHARLLKPVRQSQLCDALARCISAHFEAQETVDPVLADPKKNITVLVADDNPINLKVACAMLRKLGYDIATAADGREAVVTVARAMARRQPFGAILMDLNMPEVDGLEATRQIIAAWGDRAPPIIALTAAALPEDRVRCEVAGMVDYLTKPLQVTTLAEKLEQWLALPLPEMDSVPPDAPAAPVPANPGMPPPMDFARLEEFREFDDSEQSMIHEVVSLFLSDGPRRLQAIEAAATVSDPTALSVAAHALKGAASNIGAVALQAQCSQLEQQAKHGMPQDISASLIRLHATWARTQEALNYWINQPPPAA